MIEIREHKAAIVAVILGEFQLSDFRELETHIDKHCSKADHKPIELLIDLRDMAGFTIDVAWEELRYSRRHSNDFRRIAVVTDTEWSIWSAWIAKAFINADFRIFDVYEEALAWVGAVTLDAHHTIVSTERLAESLQDWVVFDCRHNLADRDAGRRAYETGHIPGAHFMHLDYDLASPPSGHNGRHPLPDPEALAQRLGTLGVTPSSQVVVYDDAGGAFAARMWWMLRWIGHDAVAVLDGGFPQWLAESRPIEVGADRHSQGSVQDGIPPSPAPIGLPIVLQHDSVASLAAVEDNILNGKYLLVDARAPDRFRGENETIDPVGGHIPGAINRFFKNNLEADGRFKSPKILRAEWLDLLHGRDASTVISQCGSGVTACHNLLSLEIAGLHGARLYPGSWSEWCADSRRPVAR